MYPHLPQASSPTSSQHSLPPTQTPCIHPHPREALPCLLHTSNVHTRWCVLLLLGRSVGLTTQPGQGTWWEGAPSGYVCFSLSTLMLAGISAEDEAIYQCVAENSAGSNQASTRLAVTGDPEPPPAPRGLQAMALSTCAIQVFWEPPPYNGDITGYVLHLRPVGGGCGWVDGNP